MTKLLLKLSGLAVVFSILVFTGCTEDDPMGPSALGPEISLLADAGFIATDAELLEGEAFSVRVSALPGDNNLRTLTFLVDGAAPQGDNLDDYITKITSGGSDVTPQNPLLILGANVAGGTWSIDLIPFGQKLDETVTYSFRVEDEIGETATVSIDITIVAPPGTPLTKELSGVLFNQAGPSGTGGLDLDDGIGTGSTNAIAEIQDEGIDRDVAQNMNWRRQMSSVNGTVMREVDASKYPEGFNFDAIDTKEAIEEAFTGGLALSGDDSPCNCTDGTSGEEVTNPIEADDLFVVQKGDTYYLIRVDEVNEVFIGQDMMGNNDDNYVLSIKY